MIFIIKSLLLCVFFSAVSAFAVSESELISNARKEGTLVVSTNELYYSDVLLDAFSKKYPFIKVVHKKFPPYGYSHWSSFKSKFEEKRIDVMFACQDFAVDVLMKNGYFLDLTDLPNWNARPESYKEHKQLVYLVATPHGLVYNKNKVKSSDLPERYEDLLDKKWFKKTGIRHIDSGNSPRFLAHYINASRGDLSWYSKLAENKVKVYAKPVEFYKDIQKGKISIGFSRDAETITFKKTYNKLGFHYLKDEMPLQYQFAAINSNAVHKATAKLLMNWVMTDGQKVLEDNGFSAGEKRASLIKHPKMWRMDYSDIAYSHYDVMSSTTGILQENGAVFVGTIKK